MLVSDLISYSLRIAGVLGVGQTALPQDTDDATTALAFMLSQWQRRRWLVYRLDEVSCPVVSGQTTYAVGPGGDLDYPARPANIASAYIRQNFGGGVLPVDFPLGRIDSREEWSRVALKSLRSWPGSFFYDPTIPLGTFYLWPIAIQTFFELHVAIEQDIRTTLTSTAEIEDFLPPEAEEALAYGLAETLIMNYALPPRPDISAKAMATLSTVRSTNLRLQKLGVPVLGGRRGSTYVRNPSAGFIETNVSVPYTTVGP